MKIDDVARAERLEEFLEATRQAQRRDKALLRSPVAPPERFPHKEIRRLCQETNEEILRRG